MLIYHRACLTPVFDVCRRGKSRSGPSPDHTTEALPVHFSCTISPGGHFQQTTVSLFIIVQSLQVLQLNRTLRETASASAIVCGRGRGGFFRCEREGLGY